MFSFSGSPFVKQDFSYFVLIWMDHYTVNGEIALLVLTHLVMLFNLRYNPVKHV